MTWWMTVCRLVLALACLICGTVLILNGHFITGPALLCFAFLAVARYENT